MSKQIVMLGAPGAGKGTQAVRLAAHLGIPTISTGALFRRHMAENTKLGELARGYIDNGDLVPDDVTNRMVGERLAQSDAAGGFILDGYPRTLDQAHHLDQLLADNPLTDVVYLWVSADEVIERLNARAEAEHRSDDTDEVIRHRIDVYRRNTRPLEEYYTERGILVEVNAVGDIDVITERVLRVLDR